MSEVSVSSPSFTKAQTAPPSEAADLGHQVKTRGKSGDVDQDSTSLVVPVDPSTLSPQRIQPTVEGGSLRVVNDIDGASLMEVVDAQIELFEQRQLDVEQQALIAALIVPEQNRTEPELSLMFDGTGFRIVDKKGFVPSKSVIFDPEGDRMISSDDGTPYALSVEQVQVVAQILAQSVQELSFDSAFNRRGGLAQLAGATSLTPSNNDKPFSSDQQVGVRKRLSKLLKVRMLGVQKTGRQKQETQRAKEVDIKQEQPQQKMNPSSFKRLSASTWAER